MSDNAHIFDAAIQTKLKGFRANPSDTVYASIKNSIPKPGLKHFISSPWGIGTVALSVIAITVFVFSQLTPENQPSNNQFVPPVVSQDDKQKTSKSAVPQDSILEEEDISEVEPETSSSQREYGKTLMKYVCGLETELDYTYDKNKICYLSKGLKIEEDSQGKMHIIAASDGEYTFIYRENPQKTDTIHIAFETMVNASAGEDTTVCGKVIKLRGSGVSGQWSSAEAMSFEHPGVPTTIARAPDFGTYVLVWTEFGPSCSFKDSVKVRFVKPPEIDYRITKKVQCRGDKLEIRVTKKPDETISWKADGCVITKKSEGLYLFDLGADFKQLISLQVSNKYCVKKRNILVNVPDPIDISLNVKHAVCGENGAVTAVPVKGEIKRYFWDGFSTSRNTMENLSPGNHELKVLDVNGCLKQYNIELKNTHDLKANFNIEIDHDNKMLKATNLTREDGKAPGDDVSYKWYLDNQFVSSAEHPEIELPEKGLHELRLEVSNSYACSDTKTRKGIKLEKDIIMIPNVFSPNGDGHDDTFRLVINGELYGFHGVITNSVGEIIFEWYQADKAWDGKINGNNLANEGVYYYIIQATDSEGRHIEKRGTLQLVRD